MLLILSSLANAKSHTRKPHHIQQTKKLTKSSTSKTAAKTIAKTKATSTNKTTINAAPKITPTMLANRFAWGLYLIQYDDLWQSIDLQHYGCILLQGISINSQTLAVDKINQANLLAQKIAIKQPCVLPSIIFSNAKQFNQLFHQPNIWKNLENSVVNLSKQSSYQGIHLHIDIYQPLTETAQQGFRVFIQQLSNKLHQQNKILTIYGTAHAQHNLFNVETIKYIDRLILQGHDATWQNSPIAGPIAPLRGSYYITWEKTLKQNLDNGIPNQKIMFTLPAYGYEWQTSSDEPGSFTQNIAKLYPLNNLPKKWSNMGSITQQKQRTSIKADTEQGGIFYVKKVGKKWIQGWFDDENATRDKLNYAEHQGLKGVLVYPLGFDGGAFAPLIAPHVAPKTDGNSLPK